MSNETFVWRSCPKFEPARLTLKVVEYSTFNEFLKGFISLLLFRTYELAGEVV